MIDRIIAIYCICDDFLKAQHVEHWPNIKMTDAELMTTFILAHTDFYGNTEKAMNTVTEDDIHAITEKVERGVMDASDKILNKYLKS